MSNLPSLLFHPHPKPAEGPRGYLLRLAAENHLLPYDINQQSIFYETENLVRHGLMPDSLLEPEYFARIRLLSLLWNTEKKLWNHRFARFCPHCLADEAYWRADWEIYFQDACPDHGVWLVDRCSSCNQQLAWNRKSIVRCECGADLRGETAAGCPEEVSRMSQILRARLLNQDVADVPLPLKALRLPEMQQLIRFMGAGTATNEGPWPLKVRDSGAMNVSWGITSAAAAILMNWPVAFHQVLDQFQSRASDHEKHALRSTFGRMYRYLYLGLKAASFDVVRDEFGEWVATRWQGGVAKRNRRLAEMMLERAVWIPAKIARDELGISQARLGRLIRSGVIDGEFLISDRGRKFCMVRRDQLAQVKQNLSGGMDLLAAADHLGFTKKRMRSVLTLLFPNASKSSELPGRGVWFVPTNDIEAVLALAQDLPVISIPDEGCVSISHILRYWTWRTIDIVAVIQAAMVGDLRPLARVDNAKGVASLVFEEAALKHWFESNARGVGKWLTCPKFAREYSISEEAAYDLVSRDFIRAERLPHNEGGGWWIRRETIDEFFRNYVFATELAARTGTVSIVVRRRLEERSIFPVSGPGIDGGKQLLYRRTPEVESFASESTQSHDFLLTPSRGTGRQVGKSQKDVQFTERSKLGG
jgi:hypothetical protein